MRVQFTCQRTRLGLSKRSVAPPTPGRAARACSKACRLCGELFRVDLAVPPRKSSPAELTTPPPSLSRGSRDV
eukprot:43932-Prymnesium_polylepis.1